MTRADLPLISSAASNVRSPSGKFTGTTIGAVLPLGSAAENRSSTTALSPSSSAHMDRHSRWQPLALIVKHGERPIQRLAGLDGGWGGEPHIADRPRQNRVQPGVRVPQVRGEFAAGLALGEHVVHGTGLAVEFHVREDRRAGCHRTAHAPQHAGIERGGRLVDEPQETPFAAGAFRGQHDRVRVGRAERSRPNLAAGRPDGSQLFPQDGRVSHEADRIRVERVVVVDRVLFLDEIERQAERLELANQLRPAGAVC